MRVELAIVLTGQACNKGNGNGSINQKKIKKISYFAMNTTDIIF